MIEGRREKSERGKERRERERESLVLIGPYRCQSQSFSCSVKKRLELVPGSAHTAGVMSLAESLTTIKL